MKTQTQSFHISNDALMHLAQSDPAMGHLIDYIGPIHREVIDDPFTALVQSIVFQQLAYGAANTIWGRFIHAVKDINPQTIKNVSDDNLRACGLSFSKIAYIKHIADAFIDGTVSNMMLQNSTDQEIVDTLVSIKGIGQWTAEMFLIFCLQRHNVFSFKDLGLRRGVTWLYQLEGEPTEAYCAQLVSHWQPYATIASLYLWEITIQKLFSKSPNDIFYEFLKVEPTQMCYYASPIGDIEFKTSKNGLESLGFTSNIEEKTQGKNTMLVQIIKEQLDTYFVGKRKVFDIPLHTIGTPFQKRVWRILSTITYGTTISYGALAIIVGNKNASRAVGGANNKNKIAIIIPCHRVIASNGALTGYAGGIDKKEWLLAHEAKYKDD